LKFGESEIKSFSAIQFPIL